MLTRRALLAGSAAALTGCVKVPEIAPVPAAPGFVEATPELPDFYGEIITEDFYVPAVPEGVIPQKFWRQEVGNPFPQHAPGTLVVDPDAGFLHLIQSEQIALRYGAGTGAQGRAWNGNAVVQFTRKWPRWKAPDSLIERMPEYAPYSVENGGMDPGPGNPLGARALYLFDGGVDTLFRIHGACEPHYLGKAVSSGCIRLLDHDAIDLAQRVKHHAPVIVLPSTKPLLDQVIY